MRYVLTGVIRDSLLLCVDAAYAAGATPGWEQACCDSQATSEPSRMETSLEAPHFRQVDLITA